MQENKNIHKKYTILCGFCAIFYSFHGINVILTINNLYNEGLLNMILIKNGLALIIMKTLKKDILIKR